MGGFELFQLSEGPLDIGSLSASLRDTRAGAFVSFEGRVRNENDNHAVVSLEYEAYPALALSEGEAVVREASRSVIAARCIHRVGHLCLGDVAVWVGVIAAHRDEAFTACRFIIDEVKKRVPIWKKEHYSDGSFRWIGLGEETSHTRRRR